MSKEVPILLLTGTIAPKSGALVKTGKDVDPDFRKRQYVRAILFYLTQTPFAKVVFCENSNFDFSRETAAIESIAQAYGKEFEYLSFLGNAGVETYGYGYGEAEIFDYAFENSKILRSGDSWYKITGRYLMRDVEGVLGSLSGRDSYFQRQGLFLSPFTVSTAFFKTSNELYRTRLFKKQRPVFEAMARSVHRDRLYFKNHFPIERVWYLLLRDRLLSGEEAKSGPPILYDYPRTGTHGVAPFLRDLAYRAYVALGLDRYGAIHRLADRLLFQKTYGEFLTETSASHDR